jgi:hypothetical protein
MNISQWTEQEIQERINEIDKEAAEIRELKRSNRLTVEDHEDVSDTYQMHLEWGYLLSELQEERNFLVQERNKFHLAD